MSTLWTPGGERPVSRQPASPPSAPSGPDPEPALEDDRSEEEIAAEMAELEQQLANTPAAIVVANHAFGLFRLAALHLSLQPPQLDQASVAIDALSALLSGMSGRLGEPETQLTDGLTQLRLAFVEIKRSQTAAAAPPRSDPPPNPAQP